MHSTVQTGLFTPNIYNCEHNMYSPNGHSRNSQYHLPPHHHHLNYQRSHAKDASVHSSLLGINVLHGSHSEGLNKQDSHRSSRNNLSASNITFSSNKNLSSESNLKRKESSVSSSSIHKLSMKNEDHVHSLEHIGQEKNFWNYTKPCGLLTLVLSVLLLVFSSICFVLVFSKYVCKMANTCSNAVVILGAVSFLVIGIVMIFFGMVIVIYSKKDTQAKVIVARASDFDRVINKEHNEASKHNPSFPLLDNN